MPSIQNHFGARLPRIARAEGVWLTDTAGRRYLDGCSGAAVAAIGHAHPAVLAAIREQLDRVTYVHRAFFTDHTLEKLAEGLTTWTGYAGAWFVTSGSEAVEAALQFALQYHRERGQPHRQEFLALTRGYHGNTLGGLSLSGHARRAVVGELAWPFARLPVPYRPPTAPAVPEPEFTRALLAETRARSWRGTPIGWPGWSASRSAGPPWAPPCRRPATCPGCTRCAASTGCC